VVEDLVDPPAQLREDGQEDGVQLLAGLGVVAGVQRLVREDLESIYETVLAKIYG
jgi:hypothetical protein